MGRGKGGGREGRREGGGREGRRPGRRNNIKREQHPPSALLPVNILPLLCVLLCLYMYNSSH